MKEGLISEVDTFYHITKWSNWEKIQKEGLKKYSSEGISVLRTNDDRIVNSVTVLQLQTIEENQENRFALIKIDQKRAGFIPLLIKPDLVEEWTWPFHNNIQVPKIHLNYIKLEREFTIVDWHKATFRDNTDRLNLIDSEMYIDALNAIYQDDNGKFRYNIDKSKAYLNEQ